MSVCGAVLSGVSSADTSPRREPGSLSKRFPPHRTSPRPQAREEKERSAPMGSLAASKTSPTPPGLESPVPEVSKSARLIVNMKRELMELIKAEHYETALTVCDRRALRDRARVPTNVPCRQPFPLTSLACRVPPSRISSSTRRVTHSPVTSPTCLRTPSSHLPIVLVLAPHDAMVAQYKVSAHSGPESTPPLIPLGDR